MIEMPRPHVTITDDRMSTSCADNNNDDDEHTERSTLLLRTERSDASDDEQPDAVVRLANRRIGPDAVRLQPRRSARAAAADRSVYRWLNVRRLDRARLLVFTVCLAFVVYIVFSSIVWLCESDEMLVVVPYPPLNPDYLVMGPNCRIPNLDPLAPDVMRLFHRNAYTPCSERPALTYVAQRIVDGRLVVQLLVNQTLLPSYNRQGTIDRCCYQRIQRNDRNLTSDNDFRLGHCEPLPLLAGRTLPDDLEFVLVRCKAGARAAYTNAHAIVRVRPELQRRLDAFAERRKRRDHSTAERGPNDTDDARRPLSVLMLSIDSISRLNLLRAMPKTAQHLYDNGWFELQGYNKMGDSTFPNVMAILLGYNSSLAYEKCVPTELGRLDACPIVWYDFRRNGYVTAYGEDETSINTFNYNKRGFKRPPTDYYMRPYMLAAEKNLPHKRQHWLTFCLGYRHSADHVYQYGIDFAAAYRGQPFFGLFWANTFSHNDISDPSELDEQIRDYVRQLADRGILEDSAVVFFSDHGIRFGPIRMLHTGWLEERLPFMFVWLPEWFRRQHPEAVKALRANRNRFTTPYDLHVTLKHILRMAQTTLADDAQRDEQPVSMVAESCPLCQSLFEPMPWNRSCQDGAIDAHWCTCNPFAPQATSDALVLSAVRFVLTHINDALLAYEQRHPRKNGGRSRRLCAKLRLGRISNAGMHRNGTHQTYLLMFTAEPSDGWFEATVQYDVQTAQYRLDASVSRLDSYAAQSACMPDDVLRKYCYCA